MSKILLINGSPNRAGCTFTALSELALQLSKNGVESEIYQIGTAPVAGCTVCKYCWRNGKCVVDDAVNAIGQRLDEFDGIVMGSPVYYGSASGQLCALLDRLFYVYGSKMAGKLAAYLGNFHSVLLVCHSCFSSLVHQAPHIAATSFTLCCSASILFAASFC